MLLLLLLVLQALRACAFCPAVDETVVAVDFSPAFLTLDDEYEPELPGLGVTVSSFFQRNRPDLVARLEAPSGKVEAATASILVEGGQYIEPREVRTHTAFDTASLQQH